MNAGRLSSQRVFCQARLVPLVSFLLGTIFFVSCTRSSGLTGSGGTAPAASGSISGTVQGGLSGISGATVSLYQAGSPPKLLGSTQTAKDGTFNVTNFSAPSSSGLLYFVVTGGNAGSGTNTSTQLMAIAGTGTSQSTGIIINELTTAAAQTTAFNLGLLNDASGNVTLLAPVNATGASNVNAQYVNFVVSTTGQLNTSNSNLSTAMQNALGTMANAFASCVENSSKCSTLMSTATGISGGGALNLLESGFNMLSNSSTVASGVYSIASGLSSSTGFSIPSTIPGGFSFNNSLAANVKTFTAGTSPDKLAIDASGNIWVANFRTANNVTEVSSSGAVLGTFSAGNHPYSITIDGSQAGPILEGWRLTHQEISGPLTMEAQMFRSIPRWEPYWGTLRSPLPRPVLQSIPPVMFGSPAQQQNYPTPEQFLETSRPPMKVFPLTVRVMFGRFPEPPQRSCPIQEFFLELTRLEVLRSVLPLMRAEMCGLPTFQR